MFNNIKSIIQLTIIVINSLSLLATMEIAMLINNKRMGIWARQRAHKYLKFFNAINKI